ncbi:MAG: PLP-dependent aminotransferase family protein, partial [Enterobacteriaceae bacterium]
QLPDSSEHPLYVQIVLLIEEKIHHGALLPGEKLPSERTLAQLLQVNRSTVVTALEQLAERGIVVKKTGSGTLVSDDKWGLFTGKSNNWRRYISRSAFLPSSANITRLNVARQRHGRSILDLASGELPVELLPQITLPAYSWQSFLNEEQQESSAGYFPLRQTLQQQLTLSGRINSNAEQIFITSGAQQAIFLITQCLLHAGDAIAIEAPSYFYALSLFQSAGLRIFALPMDAQGVRIDALMALHRKQHIKMVFVNPTFHNPTGLVMSLTRRQQFVAACSRLRVPIVEDDPYYQLSFAPDSVPPPLKALDADNVLYIGSLSKVMGTMTRIGWLIGPAAIIHRLSAARQEMDFGLSIFPQVLANYALNEESFRQHLTMLREALHTRCQHLISALERHLPGQLHYEVPQGGFHLWCHLPEQISAQRCFEQLLRHDMLTMPADDFGVKQNALRLTFARLKPEEADRAGEILAAVI